MSERETFPTLAETPRHEWPENLRTIAPNAAVWGDVERVVCSCTRPVPADEMIDLRAIPAADRAGLGIASPLQCAACFHMEALHGRTAHSEIALQLALAPHVHAALQAGERQQMARGHVVQTARHLRERPRIREPSEDRSAAPGSLQRS
jgi:hypothetical protein